MSLPQRHAARSSGGLFLLAALALPLTLLLAFLTQASAQQQPLLVLTAPATPYQTNIVGPAPPVPDEVLVPLPQNPQPPLGQAGFQINLFPEGIAPSIPIPPNMLGLSIELSVADEFCE